MLHECENENQFGLEALVEKLNAVNLLSRAVPIYRKYTLTVDEAAMYFGIGQNRLRRLIAENSDADYLVSIGSKTLIKRKLFEQFVDNATAI